MTEGSNPAAGTLRSAALDDEQAHARESGLSDLSMLGSPLETLEGYKILEHIGGGAFGEVTTN